MNILVIGATGTIGQAVVAALSPRHQVVSASLHGKTSRVDITDIVSLHALYGAVGPIDAVVCAAGAARFNPLAQLTDDDFAFSLRSKLMGQVNVVRLGLDRVREGGVIVITSGILSRAPTPGSSAISLVNGGLEAFVRAAALEAPRGVRVNAVSPPWLSETLAKLGMDAQGGLPAASVAQAYVRAIEGTMTGQVLEPAAAPGH